MDILCQETSEVMYTRAMSLLLSCLIWVIIRKITRHWHLDQNWANTSKSYNHKPFSLLFFANPIAFLRSLQLQGHIFNSMVKSLNSRAKAFHLCWKFVYVVSLTVLCPEQPGKKKKMVQILKVWLCAFLFPCCSLWWFYLWISEMFHESSIIINIKHCCSLWSDAVVEEAIRDHSTSI